MSYIQHYIPLASSMHNACFGIDLLKIYIHKENRRFQRPFCLGFLVKLFFSFEMDFFQVWPPGMSFLLLSTVVKCWKGTAVSAVEGVCVLLPFSQSTQSLQENHQERMRRLFWCCGFILVADCHLQPILQKRVPDSQNESICVARSMCHSLVL